MAVNRTGLLVQQIGEDVGLFVQAVASLELALDDLLGLANDRFDGKENISSKYPVQISEKIKVLPTIADLVNFALPKTATTSPLERVLDLRQRLVHGKIVDMRAETGGYRITIAKMGMPERAGRAQMLLRDRKDFTAQDFFHCAKDIQVFFDLIEDIRQHVFAAGDGWPNYLVMPEGDPLRLSKLHEEWVAYE